MGLQHTTANTAQDLFEFLQQIPEEQRNKLPLTVVVDDSIVSSGEVHLTANDTDDERRLQIDGYVRELYQD